MLVRSNSSTVSEKCLLTTEEARGYVESMVSELTTSRLLKNPLGALRPGSGRTAILILLVFFRSC